MAAAEQAGRSVIGVDVDQSVESPTVITSAMKELKASVYAILTDFYSGRFPGGTTQVFGADNDGVGLPMETSKFVSFSVADYDAIYAELASGRIPRMMDDPTFGGSPAAVTVSRVGVTYIE
jgi:basic membrane protein A